MLRTVEGTEQWQTFADMVTDPRPRVATGWPQLDALLNRGSFGPGDFVILAGRLHTRKTAVMMNLIAQMLDRDLPVGLVSLDEGNHSYVAKLCSVFTRIPHTELHETWGTPEMDAVRQMYLQRTRKLVMSLGQRPSLHDMAVWLDMALVERPRVVFIDFLSLLERGKYDGKDTNRIPRLCEELQVWAAEQEVTLFVLHQVGRQGDDQVKVHGSNPVTPEQLMYGGEQQADIILATYRPSLDPIGNLSQEDAIAAGIDGDKWQERRDRVFRYRDDTFLQLIKNRPGVRLNVPGVRLTSKGESQHMEEWV